MNSAPLNGFVLIAAIAAGPSGGLNTGPIAGLALATSNASSPSGGLLILGTAIGSRGLDTAPLNGFVVAATAVVTPSGGLNTGPLAGIALATSNASSPTGGLLVVTFAGPQDLEEALQAKLAGSLDLTALIDDRLFYANLPQTLDLERDGPALTHLVAERAPGHDLVGSDGTQVATVRITALGARMAVVDRIAEATRNVIFDKLPWGDGSVKVLSVVAENEEDQFGEPRAGSDQWTYQIVSDYSIKHRVSIPTLS